MKYLKVILFFLLIGSSYAQNNAQEPSFIEVVGTSEKEIIPDEIYLDIFLKERMEKGEKVKLESLENKLKQELKNIGIPLENLFISDVNSVLAKTGWFTKEILSTAKYNLKVVDAKKLKQLFECFDELKIDNVTITKATHSKITELQKENRITAIKAAKDKATYLLAAIGEKVGKPIKIHEIDTNNQNFAFANTITINEYSSGISKVRKEKYITQFEKIILKTSMYIKFEIK